MSLLDVGAVVIVPLVSVTDVMSVLAPLSANGAPPADVEPVPPLPIAKVPPRVMVPLLVIGPPLAVKPVVPPDTSTDVTVPEPPPATAGVGGGASCRSSKDVWLLPPPTKVNMFKKNRYHSRDISPVRGSINSTRDEGRFVILSCSGIGRAQNQFSAHDGNFHWISARHFIDSIP